MPKVKLFDENIALEKAMELFWKKGYHATSIQDLVTYLGLSRSSIYDTYGGKKQLFYKAFALYRSTNTLKFTDFLKQEQQIKKGLKKVFQMAIEQSIADLDKKGCFVVNTTTELIPGEIEIETAILENKNTFVSLFYDFLVKGEKSGEIPRGKDLKSIAILLFTLYNGIKVISKIKPDSKEIMSAVDTILSLLD